MMAARFFFSGQLYSRAVGENFGCLASGGVGRFEAQTDYRVCAKRKCMRDQPVERLLPAFSQ
jgi:hypothetical protein